MSKFGELIANKTIVIFKDNEVTIDDMSRTIAQELAPFDIKTVVIQSSINTELVEALKIKYYPTIMYFNDNEMKVREVPASDNDVLSIIDDVKKLVQGREY